MKPILNMLIAALLCSVTLMGCYQEDSDSSLEAELSMVRGELSTVQGELDDAQIYIVPNK